MESFDGSTFFTSKSCFILLNSEYQATLLKKKTVVSCNIHAGNISVLFIEIVKTLECKKLEE